VKVLNLKNLKNLEELGIVLKGNFGIRALRNPNGSIAYRLKKRIKGKGVISRTLGYFPQMSIKEAEREALRLSNLCQKGIEPKEYDKLLEAKKQSSIDKDIRRQRTVGQTIKQYVDNKRLQQQNSESYIKERHNCLKAICSDWFNEPIINISFPEVEERFNKVAYRKGTLGRAKSWARYMKAIFEWAKQRSYIDNNPFTRLKAEVKTFQSGKRENNYLLPEEARYIYDKVKESNKINVGHYAVVLLLTTGLRKSEALKLKWENVFLSDVNIPYFIFDLGTRKQKHIRYAVPIVPKMKFIFERMKTVRRNEYVFPSRKINYCHYDRLDASFKFLRPPQLDNPKINTTGLVNEKRVEELSAITLRRTWTQIGLELGYDTNILNVLSGRSKNLGTKTALGSYTSANLKMAVSFYEQIIDRVS
jgi:integrase